MKAENLADLYDLPLLDWASVEARLHAGITQAPDTGGLNRHTCWLTTINPDGSPHVTGVGALWADGAFWFETGAQTRKGKNVARDPRCALCVSTHDFDLVVEGTAAQVTDPPTVAAMAALGGRGMAGPRRQHRQVHHCRLQRTLCGTASVVRVPHYGTYDDRDRHG